jgi:hypothetical protein
MRTKLIRSAQILELDPSLRWDDDLSFIPHDSYFITHRLAPHKPFELFKINSEHLCIIISNRSGFD